MAGKVGNMRGLTADERKLMTHMSMWGSDGYPLRKLGRGWIVQGVRGLGSFPKVYKTKKEAASMWERYVGILRDRKAGRL